MTFNPRSTARSIRRPSSLTTALLCFALLGCDKESAGPEAGAWVDQNVAHSRGCGPTSILNAMALLKPEASFGTTPKEAILGLINTYGGKDSVEYEGAERWNPEEGVAPGDLLAWYNEVRGKHDLQPVTGRYLDRRKNESASEHLHRIHAVVASSLRRGEPVMVRLRSFAPEDKGDGILWQGRFAHYVLVINVTRRIRKFDQGFTIDYVDPAGAEVHSAYVYVAGERNFTAAKGNSKTWVWLPDRPFLVVAAAELSVLGRAREPWHRRTVITFDHAIGDPEPERESSAVRPRPTMPSHRAWPRAEPPRPRDIQAMGAHVPLFVLASTSPNFSPLLQELREAGIETSLGRVGMRMDEVSVLEDHYPRAVRVLARSKVMKWRTAEDFANLLETTDRLSPPR